MSSTLRFGASYYPQHRDKGDWSADLQTMAAAHVNALRVGDFAWGRLEPEADRWTFDWLDRFVDQAWSHDIGILLAPPARCAPPWLIAADPSVQIVDADGVRLGFGSRYTFCINHTMFRRKALEISEQMVKRYADHPAVIGWHLDNEHGDEPDCHCSTCAKLWAQWLERRYTDIDALNRAWGTVFWSMEFAGFEQVPTPAKSKTFHNPALLLDWRRFRSECTVDLVREQADVVKRYDAVRPITTNLQCLWNPRTNYYELADVLDVAGLNYYPPYGKCCRDNSLGLAVARGAVSGRLEIHELRNGPHAVPGRRANTPEPGEIERLTMHVIAHGADAVYYFQWAGVPFGAEQTHGTIVGYDGRPLRAYRECRAIGERLEKLAPMLQDTRVQSDIAMVYDFPSQWFRQGNEEWMGPGNLLNSQAKAMYNAIRKLGVNCDAVGRDADWMQYKVLIVPLLDTIDDGVVERLTAFVRSGGILIWNPLSGTRNHHAEVYPTRLHPGLEALFGLSVREIATLDQDETRTFEFQQKRYEAELFIDLPELTTAAPLGEYRDGWIAGTPAVCRNRVGEGSVIYVTTFAEPGFYRNLLDQLMQEVSIEPILGVSPPDQIEVCERSSPDGKRLIFLLNASNDEVTMNIDGNFNDIWNDDSVRGALTFGPWQVRIGQLKSASVPINHALSEVEMVSAE